MSLLIDMGPGDGAGGGRVVACGSPRDLLDDAASITARYFRQALGAGLLGR